MKVITIALLININQSFGFSNQELTITRIIDNHHIQLSNDTIISIPNVTLPDKVLHKDRFDSCYYLKVKSFLQQTLIGQAITYSPNQITLIETQEDATELLLKKGYAQNTSDIKSLNQIQITAQHQKVGIWKGCKPKPNNNKLLSRWKNFSQSQANGIVADVIDNNTIRLANGLYVKLQGIKSVNEKLSPAHQCFRQKSIHQMKELLINRQVYLKKDKYSSDSTKTIERHVFLIEDFPTVKQIYVNQWLVKNGYGLPKKTTLYPHTFQIFEANSIKAIKSNIGAWKQCNYKVMNYLYPEQNTTPPTTESCTIKGNITGSKSKPIKKYHTKNSPWYDRVKAEKCFENETEAQDSGFTKVK